MLGNMDQPLWAWLDPQAVHLLDFWQQQSEHTVFMLVYDDIHNIYQQCLQSGAEASPESINAKVQSWVAYNEALLQFHLRNPERSFLVHAKQVAQSAQSYVQQINQRVAAPLQLAVGHSTAAEQPVDAVEQPNSQLASMGEPQNLPSATTQPGTEGLTNWLIEQLVNTQSDALQLYEELQAAANLPLAHVAGSAPAADAAALQQAWASFAAAQLQYRSNCQQVQNLQQQLQAQAQTMAEAAQQKQGALQAQLQDAKEEKALLLEQLHKVQEELEKLYLQGKEDKKNLENLNAQTKKLQEQLSAEQQTNKKDKDQLAAEQKTIKAHQEQLAKTPSNQKTDASVTELKEENDLLLKQLHIVQEELEPHYLQNQKVQQDLHAAENEKAAALKVLAQENQGLMLQLQQLESELELYLLENKRLKASAAVQQSPSKAKSSAQAYYGAADRIKRQLSYRLGAVMIQKSRSLGGWVSMPFALTAETRRFRQEMAARKGQKLPPIASYRDAHEAERVKKHLSYRLGSTLVQRSGSLGGWLSMPWALCVQVKAFRQSRR